MTTASLTKAIAIVAEALSIPVEHLNADSAFDNTDQWDSLGHMRIIMALESTLERSLSGMEIMEIAGCSDIVLIIDAN